MNDACSITFPIGTSPPGRAVGWVHTHPYGFLESTEYRQLRGLDPAARAAFDVSKLSPYQGHPSRDDIETNRAFRGMASTDGIPRADFLGVILDKHGITLFNKDSQSSGQNTDPKGTCGYQSEP